MNIDDLKTQWAAQDRVLETSFTIRVNADRLKKIGLAKSAFRRLSGYVIFNQAVNILAIILNGIFIGNHFQEPRFLVPAILLDLGLIGMIVANAFHWEALSKVDYHGPVKAIQETVERLKVLRVRITQCVVLLSPLFWLPLLVVGLKGLLGIDAFRVFEPWFWVANGLFGLLWIPLALLVAKRFGHRFSNSAFGRQFIEEIGGSSLMTAKRHLDELSRLEREAGE